jgi:serine/threonine-protein kinase HipA
MNSKLSEKYYAVILHEKRVGTLFQKGDYTRFIFNREYLENPNRPVLGLRFEQALRKPYSAALQLPPWFSNLLPEGPLREWIALDKHVSLDREMELLSHVGHDLPGAVQILPTETPDADSDWHAEIEELRSRVSAEPAAWRFSLAGVALKLSMLQNGDRLTVPAAYEQGDWLVKFPDYKFPDVPRNEFAMMTLASLCGINVPDIRLIHRDELLNVPRQMWPTSEVWAYAIRRFDRLPETRKLVHIEDLAQVKDIYPREKYLGSFDTVAALVYRGHDLDSLHEFARRLTFSILIGNGDAHLKNWSLRYVDNRIPSLSPAYDLVSTEPYANMVSSDPEDLGLKFNGSKRFTEANLSSFQRLEARLDERLGKTSANLAQIASDTARKTVEAWSVRDDLLADVPALRKAVDGLISSRSRMLS